MPGWTLRGRCNASDVLDRVCTVPVRELAPHASVQMIRPARGGIGDHSRGSDDSMSSPMRGNLGRLRAIYRSRCGNLDSARANAMATQLINTVGDLIAIILKGNSGILQCRQAGCDHIGVWVSWKRLIL